MQLGENLRKFRKNQGLTQGELAQKLFVTTQAVSKWERGESEPDICHICELAKLLKISVDTLLGVTPAAPPALLAVDGGGTKTEFVLISTEGQLLHRLVLPGTNPNNCTREDSFRIFCQGIDQMLQREHSILGIFIGCAGMASSGNGQAMTDALRKQYPGIKLRCDSDIHNILASAQDPGNAIAVICGTGSVVYATCRGVLRRCGGGGWLIDPVGSGFGMGKDALLAALEHKDGTGQATALTKAVEQQLGDTVWNSIHDICDSTPGQLAAYAPLVVDGWQAGDPVATDIVERHAQRLVHLILCAKDRSPAAKELLLGGSLLTSCTSFREHVIRLLPKGLGVSPIPYPPVWGACLQCAALCALPKPSFDLFKAQYEGMVK